MNNKIFTIYKISFPNGKVYIGQTYHYHQRIKEHLNEMKHSDYKLYRAMRKYNINENNFSIVEENILTQKDADNKEIYYINLYDSYNNGYNSTLGGHAATITKIGEEHPKAILNDNELLELRKIRYSMKYTFGEVYDMYKNKMSKSGFSKYWHYYTRPEIGEEYNTDEVNKFYKSDRRTRRGILHANSRNLSDEEVLNIRIRYFVNGEKEDDIFKKYKHLYSKSGFNKILFGQSYMHVKMPIKTDKCKQKLPQLSKEEVISLREQYNNGKSINELKVGKYEKYSMNNFRNMLIGRTYKNY